MDRANSPTSRLATLVIWITAFTYLGFAVWLGTRPNALLELFEIQDRTTAMNTEIRAFYGGIEAGIAGAMFILWLRKQVWSALLIGGLPLLFSAMGRGLGMLVDGYSGTHAILAAAELTGAAICLITMLQNDSSETSI